MNGEMYELASREAFCQRAATLLAEAAAEAVAARGRFLLVLTGGRTVQPLYRFLAADSGAALRNTLASRTCFFWGDERWVAPEHPDSNQGLARRLLLAPLAVGDERLQPIITDLPDPLAGARAYEERLKTFFAGDLCPGGAPVFDAVLLGLGPDGHVASLFPGAPLLAEQRRWVGRVGVPDLTPRVARITLTLPVLNRARLVLILAAGEERIALARRIGAGEGEGLPAALVRPAGRLVWLLADGA